jgi:hypothetical protein
MSSPERRLPKPLARQDRGVEDLAIPQIAHRRSPLDFHAFIGEFPLPSSAASLSCWRSWPAS